MMFWICFLLLVPVFFVGDIADQRAIAAKIAPKPSAGAPVGPVRS